MTALDHFADDPGAQHFRIDIAKVCSFFAEGSTKSVDDDDIAHGALLHQASIGDALAITFDPFSY